MITTQSLMDMLGWATLLNFGLLTLITLILLSARAKLRAFHSRLMGVEESEVELVYFRFLSSYKLLTIFFNLVPYLALRMVSTG